MADTNGNGRTGAVLPMDAPMSTCPVCQGSGKQPGFSSDPRTSVNDGLDNCAFCSGTGKV
jgi:hypothetical protein